jgi:ABC-2 type transport system ATP-binding protein
MIELCGVSKTIKRNEVLKNINLTFQKGKVYGLYGPNGSGKTMLLRAIAGLIVPTSGTVVIDGKVLHKDISTAPEVGIVIENMQLLPRYSAIDNLKILASIKNTVGIPEMIQALTRVGLQDSIEMKVRKYSLGMKQRLNLAQAIFENQQILLLDEPTNAIDEKGVALVYDIIREEKDKEKIIILATHHKEDIEVLCDQTIKLFEGEIQHIETKEPERAQ